jgi:hypothetical protein
MARAIRPLGNIEKGPGRHCRNCKPWIGILAPRQIFQIVQGVDMRMYPLAQAVIFAVAALDDFPFLVEPEVGTL